MGDADGVGAVAEHLVREHGNLMASNTVARPREVAPHARGNAAVRVGAHRSAAVTLLERDAPAGLPLAVTRPTANDPACRQRSKAPRTSIHCAPTGCGAGIGRRCAARWGVLGE